MADLVEQMAEALKQDYSDLFKKECLKSIFITFSKKWFTPEWEWRGKIEYVKGSLEGAQNFTDSSLKGLVEQMEAFFKANNI